MIVLPLRVRAELLDHARAGAPREVCGVLGGSFDHHRSRVLAYSPATNVADRPRERYRIRPAELLEILEDLEARGRRVVGFYHSHPRGPPAPSETDTAGAAWPNRSYVIGAPGSPTAPETSTVSEPSTVPESSMGIRSWRWRPDGDGFERERIVGECGEDGDRSA